MQMIVTRMLLAWEVWLDVYAIGMPIVDSLQPLRSSSWSRATRLAMLIVMVAITVPLQAAEMPIPIDVARRLSLEFPRLYIDSSPYWLRSSYSATHPEWRREILLRRGRAAWVISDRVAASETVASLNDLARTADMPVAAAYALFLQADELVDRGQYSSALSEVSRAATILRSTDDAHWRAVANAELCDAYWGTEQAESAKPFCRRAEKYFRSVADEWYLARLENIMAMLQEADGDGEQAIATAQSARQRFERMQMPSMVAMIDDNLSSLYLESGDAERALEVSTRALALELKAGKLQHAVSSHMNIANALSALGRHREAQASIDAAKDAAAKVDLSSFRGIIETVQMDIAEAAGDFPRALSAARNAIDASYELNDEQRQRAIAELEARYKADEQKREIERLDQEQRIQDLELARSQEENARQAAQLARQDLWLWFIGVTTSALAVVSLLLLMLWRASRRHAQRMRLLADTDGLTGVLNRRAMVERLQRCHDDLRRDGGSACLCILDADHFKRINDTRGHQVGDQALKRIARAMADGMPHDAAIGRMGGEEFALLLPGVDHVSGLGRAEQMRLHIADDHLCADGLGFPMTVSIGVAILDPDRMPNCESWMVAADKALYRAKAAGRNRCELALDWESPPDRRVQEPATE